MKRDARQYAISSMRPIVEKLRGKSISEAGGHDEEMKQFFAEYGHIIRKSKEDIGELERECHEMINEDLSFALNYLFDWDYRINVPKLKKEIHRLIDIRCLCDMVARARVLLKEYAPKGTVLEEIIYRRYCSPLERSDMEVWEELGMGRSDYYKKKKLAIQYMGFYFYEIVIPQVLEGK